MSEKQVSAEELVSEAHENVRRDRDRLEKFLDRILSVSEAAADGLGVVEIAENVSRLSDALTRSNVQLLELAKLRIRRDSLENKKGKETESIYDEIDTDPFREERN